MDNAIVRNLALQEGYDRVESRRTSKAKAIRLSEQSVRNVEKKRKRGLLGMITEKVATKKINKEIEKYQKNIKELTERKEELSGSKYMIEQGVVGILDNKINITEKTIKALQESKEIIHTGNKPLRMATYMIKLIKEKTSKRLAKMDRYKIKTEKNNDMSHSENQPIIENASPSMERMRPISSTAIPKMDIISGDENKIISINRENISDEQNAKTNPIDALVQETIARQNQVETRLKEEQSKLDKATEKKNNNIIELQRAIEARNKQIAEKEAELQRKRKIVKSEQEEAARIEAVLKMLNSSNDDSMRKSM